LKEPQFHYFHFQVKITYPFGVRTKVVDDVVDCVKYVTLKETSLQAIMKWKYGDVFGGET